MVLAAGSPFVVGRYVLAVNFIAARKVSLHACNSVHAWVQPTRCLVDKHVALGVCILYAKATGPARRRIRYFRPSLPVDAVSDVVLLLLVLATIACVNSWENSLKSIFCRQAAVHAGVSAQVP